MKTITYNPETHALVPRDLIAENERLKHNLATTEQTEQETAEAIAKLLENGNFLSKESLIALAANGAAKAIRSGAWKEYK